MKNQFYDNRDAFLFSSLPKPQLDSNTPWNIYYLFIDYENSRTTSDINDFVKLFNCLLKRMQIQGSKNRSIIPMLNKNFVKHFNVFKVSRDASANFIKLFSLPWIITIRIHVCLLYSLFLLFFVFLLVCLFFFCGYHVFIASASSIFVSMYFDLFVFLCVGILYYNITIIQYFFIVIYFFICSWWYSCVIVMRICVSYLLFACNKLSSEAWVFGAHK